MGDRVARTFKEGDKVIVRNYAQGQGWLAGVVVSADGELSYTVELLNGLIVKRHVDQMRARAFVDGTREHISPQLSETDNTTRGN